MKRVALIATLAGVVSGAAFAQAVRINTKDPGYGTDVAFAQVFDPNTKISFKAKVKGVTVTAGGKKGEANSVSYLVKPFTMYDMGNGKKGYHWQPPITVEVGPEWYVDSQDAKIKPGDYVQIIGSRQTYHGDIEIIASMVRKNHDVLALRRLSGEPFWEAYANKTWTSSASSESAVFYIAPPSVPPTGFSNSNFSPLDSTNVFIPGISSSQTMRLGNVIFLPYWGSWNPNFPYYGY